MKKKLAYIALLVVATLLAAACSSNGSDSSGLETATSGGGDATIKNILNNKEDNSKQSWTGTCTQDPTAKRLVIVPESPEDGSACTAEFTNTYVWVKPAVAGTLAISNTGGKCMFGLDLEIHEGGIYVVWNATPADTAVFMYSDANCKLGMTLTTRESSGNQSASDKGSSEEMDTCKMRGRRTYIVGKEKCSIALANEVGLLTPAFVGMYELTAVSGACYIDDSTEPMEVGKTLRAWVSSRLSVLFVGSPPGRIKKCKLEAGMVKPA